ncbi:MAG: hypothetical protein MUP47_02195 [Phycisphaerae bacterium]|nr:hypothetical protein [Phycisphaerae bacterium]
MALIAECNRDHKKKSDPFQADDFDPYALVERAERARRAGQTGEPRDYRGESDWEGLRHACLAMGGRTSRRKRRPRTETRTKQDKQGEQP